MILGLAFETDMANWSKDERRIESPLIPYFTYGIFLLPLFECSRLNLMPKSKAYCINKADVCRFRLLIYGTLL